MQIAVRSGDEWSDLLTQVFAVPLVVNRLGSDFHAALTHLQLSADISVTEITATGCAMARTPRLLSTDPSNDAFFVMHMRGEHGVIRQNDREAVSFGGTGAFYDAAQPYDLYFGDSCGLVFQMSRTAILDHPNEPLPTAVQMAAAMPSMRVLRAAMAELFTVKDSLDVDTAEAMGQVVTDLLRATVRSSRAGAAVNPTGRSALLRAMQATVADNLGDPDLGPAYLAARHHISLRYAQSLFNDIATAPATYIREQRLLAAYRQLGSVRYAHLPIAAIATRTGFADLSTFTRAFRRRFGCTPSDRRATRLSVADPSGPDQVVTRLDQRAPLHQRIGVPAGVGVPDGVGMPDSVA